MKVFVYVDGFNLYNRALRGNKRPDGRWDTVPGLKWLDLRALARRLLHKDDSVACIKYFTARVSGRSDPDAPARQQIYLNGLSSLPELIPYFGTFKNRTKLRPLVNPIVGHGRMQWFHDTEEKGSDVNLASHLVFDGCHGHYEAAAVISNDTDLVEPIRLVTQNLGLKVVLLSPCKAHEELANIATAKRQIHRHDLKHCQFPNPVALPDGRSINKPAGW